MPGLEAKLVRVPSDPLVDGLQRLVVHHAGRECFSVAECAVVRHQLFGEVRSLMFVFWECRLSVSKAVWSSTP